MASEKYLALVGLGEEDTAHLRLLLRMVAGQLEYRWRWGAEENADLMIVDPDDLAGQIARNRAFSSGRRCAVFSAAAPLRDGELRLNRPPKAENLALVLNGSTANTADFGTPVTQHKDDFYDLDTLNPEFELEDEEVAAARSHQRESTPAMGLDEMLKPDTARNKPQFAVPMQLDDDTLIDGTGGQSKRGDRRMADSTRGFEKPGKQEGINMAPSQHRIALTDEVPVKQTLRDYVTGHLLGGPAMISIEGAPSLALDPKEKVFHAKSDLSALIPYCHQALPASGWRRITSTELAALRAEQPARSYARLIWLNALVHSDGRLAPHLDPGGRYRLKSRPDIDREYPNHVRIAAALLMSASKLNEIAATSGAPMADVFALVTAYDAIGLIEVERRQPRHDSPPPAATGLLARLRKPFGKG